MELGSQEKENMKHHGTFVFGQCAPNTSQIPRTPKKAFNSCEIQYTCSLKVLTQSFRPFFILDIYKRREIKYNIYLSHVIPIRSLYNQCLVCSFVFLQVYLPINWSDIMSWKMEDLFQCLKFENLFKHPTSSRQSPFIEVIQ